MVTLNTIADRLLQCLGGSPVREGLQDNQEDEAYSVQDAVEHELYCAVVD